MSEISLEQLVDELVSLNDENLARRVVESGDVQWCLSELQDILAADVAPVVHGHFVHDGPRFAGGVDWWHCSNCGRLVSGVETHFDYCPWCGAKMDGGDNDVQTD